MSKIKVTLAQIPEQKNLKRIKSIIKQKKDSDLIVFPEDTIKTSDLSVINELQSLAKKYDTCLVVGIIYKKGKKIYDNAYFISPDTVDYYQKIHVHWTEKHVPGKKFKVIKSKLGKIGLLICFDGAFQEAGQILALQGAEIIVIIHSIPASFPYRINLIRSQAMALNNQIFVVDCCKPGRKYTGHGAIFNPRGEELTELGKYKKIISQTIDLAEVKRWRRQEKIFPYRQPQLYKLITKRKYPKS